MYVAHTCISTEYIEALPTIATPCPIQDSNPKRHVAGEEVSTGLDPQKIRDLQHAPPSKAPVPPLHRTGLSDTCMQCVKKK